jgi:aminoglycoside phosphotransferase
VTCPSSPPPVPPIVSRLARGRAVRAVWVNDGGGVADRWADLAVATLSLVAPDPTRIDYYRRLWRAFDHTSDAASR